MPQKIFSCCFSVLRAEYWTSKSHLRGQYPTHLLDCLFNSVSARLNFSNIIMITFNWFLIFFYSLFYYIWGWFYFYYQIVIYILTVSILFFLMKEKKLMEICPKFFSIQPANVLSRICDMYEWLVCMSYFIWT